MADLLRTDLGDKAPDTLTGKRITRVYEGETGAPYLDLDDGTTWRFAFDNAERSWLVFLDRA